MEGLPMYYLWLALVWVVLLGFSLWRLLLCRKRVRPVDREITWSVYLLTLPLLVLAGAFFPDPPRPAAIAALVDVSLLRRPFGLFLLYAGGTLLFSRGKARPGDEATAKKEEK